MKLNFEILDGGRMPEIAYDPSCNLLDLFVCIKGREKEIWKSTSISEEGSESIIKTENFLLQSHTTLKIPTGIKMEIPVGFFGLILPRSSAFCKGINICGVIDSDYRGEIHIVVQNTTSYLLSIKHHDKIAQMAILKKENIELERVLKINENTHRSTKGFGSSDNSSQRSCDNCINCREESFTQAKINCPFYNPLTKCFSFGEINKKNYVCARYQNFL